MARDSGVAGPAGQTEDICLHVSVLIQSIIHATGRDREQLS